MSSTHARRAAAAAWMAATVGLASGSAAFTADVRFDPRVEVGVQTNDNYLLAVGSRQRFDVTGPYAELAAIITAASPLTTWSLEPRIRILNFPDDSIFNTTDTSIVGSVDRRGQKSRFGANLEFYDEDVAQSELPRAEFGGATLGEGVGSDAGRVSPDNRRRHLRFRPYVQYSFDERTRGRIELNFLDVSFDKQFAGDQESYKTSGASVSLSRDLTQASTVGLIGDLVKVEPDLADSEGDLSGLRLQWDLRLGERLSAYARAGARRSEFQRSIPAGSTFVLLRQEDTTPLVGLGAQWRFLRSELFVDLQRELDANSSGFVVQRDELRIYYNHRFTARVRAYAAAYRVADEAPESTPFYTPREYFSAGGGLEWRVTKAFSVLGGADWSDQKFDGSASGSSTAFRVSAQYRPQRPD